MFSKTVTLDSKDLESVERVLAALVGAPARLPERDFSPNQLSHFGRLIFSLRQQRSDFVHPAMLGEPAFDMLLSLYAVADGEAGLSLARLSELSRVPHSSGLRWVEYLCSKKLIARQPHPTDKRSSLVYLTDEGRSTLDALFTAMLNQVMEFAEAA